MITTKFLVRFTECDSYGIVSHPNYLNWLTECRINYFRKCHLSEKLLNEANIFLVMVRVNLICKNPCTYGDNVVIETKLEKINKKSIVFKYVAKIENTEKIIFEAETANYVTSKEGKLVSFSPEIFEKIIEFNSKAL